MNNTTSHPEALESKIKPVVKSRISDEVVVQLTNLILDGSFLPDEKLPAERELAGSFGINRTSLREALRKLETLGLVHIKPGDGVFVRDYTTSSGIEFVKFLLQNGIGLDRKMILDLSEIRVLFAEQMIALAAVRIDEQSIVRLEEIVESYSNAGLKMRLSGELDLAFFREIAKATKNKAFIYLFNTVAELIKNMSALYFKVEEGPDTAVILYRNLTEALRRNDRQLAVELFSAQACKDNEKLAELLGALDG